jgi:translation initiation factor SUI1
VIFRAGQTDFDDIADIGLPQDSKKAEKKMVEIGSQDSKKAKTNMVEIRSQQRGRKWETHIVGLDYDLKGLEKILHQMRKAFATGGNILQKEVIMLQGDIRKDARAWLHEHEICDKSKSKVYGF